MPVFLVTINGNTLNIDASSREALQRRYPGAYVNPTPRSKGAGTQYARLDASGTLRSSKTNERGHFPNVTLDQAYQEQSRGAPQGLDPNVPAFAGGSPDYQPDGSRFTEERLFSRPYDQPGLPQQPVQGLSARPSGVGTTQARTLELAARAGGSPPTRTNTVVNEEEARDVAQGQQLLAGLQPSATPAADSFRRFSRGMIGDEIDPATGLPFTTVPRPPTVDRTSPVVPSAAPRVSGLGGRGVIAGEIDPTTGLPFTTVPRQRAPDDRYISPYNMPFDTSAAAAAARSREAQPVAPPVPALPSAAAGGGGEVDPNTGLTYEQQRQQHGRDTRAAIGIINGEIDPNTGVQFVTPTAPATGTGTGQFGLGTGITVRAPLGQPGQSELIGMGLPSLEEQSLGGVFAQYLQDQGAGRGVNPLVSNYARGQGQTAQQLFGAAQRIGGGNPDIDEASQFRDFLSRTPNYGTQSLLGTAMGDISRTVGQGLLPGSEQFSRFNPQNISEGSDLANLARAASQRNVSPFIRRDFYQRPGLTNDQLFDTFAANRDRGNAQGFADYLGQSFGLRDFRSQLGLV